VVGIPGGVAHIGEASDEAEFAGPHAEAVVPIPDELIELIEP
jgi:hypothetical protein